MDQSQYRKCGVTCFINILKYWCPHGCTTDGLVDACE